MVNTWDISNRLVADLQREFGIPKGTAQGIVGALAMESRGFQELQERKPLVPGSRGGYGFAQWTGPRRVDFENYANSKGLSVSSYEANRDYLFEELKGVGNHDMRVLSKLQGVTDPYRAQEIFTNTFLRPGIPHPEQRREWTRQVLANDATPPAGTTQGMGGTRVADSGDSFRLENLVAPTPPRRPDNLSGEQDSRAQEERLAVAEANLLSLDNLLVAPTPPRRPEQERELQEAESDALDAIRLAVGDEPGKAEQTLAAYLEPTGSLEAEFGLQDLLRESEDATSLTPESQQALRDRAVISGAGASAVPSVANPEDFNFPDLAKLGSLAPKIEDLQEVEAAETSLREAEQAKIQEQQKALESQSKIAPPTTQAATAQAKEEEEFNLGEAFGSLIEDAFREGFGIGTDEKPGPLGSLIKSFGTPTKSVQASLERKTQELAKAAYSQGKDIVGNAAGTRYEFQGKEVTPQVKVRKNHETNRWEEYIGYS